MSDGLAEDATSTTTELRSEERVVRPGEAESLAGGTHWRLETRRGVVHVWTPANYDPATAGLVLYVHGYRSHVDRAWVEHRLVEQFAASGVNALFVVPRAPVSKRQRVRFRNIGDLVREVRDRAGLERPWGRVVAIGHSGAYRTLSSWLDDPDLEHVILLDGLYNHQERFQEWLDDRRGTRHRMTLVTMDTIRESDRFVRSFPDAQILDWVPGETSDFSEKERDTRLLYIHSQFDHMAMVTQAQVIPVLLARAFESGPPAMNETDEGAANTSAKANDTAAADE